MGRSAIVQTRTGQPGRADVAQLVAHNLAKVRVASSSLVIRSGLLILPPGYREVGSVSERGGNATVEWLSGLGNGLQNRVHGFDSRFHLVSRAFSSAGERFPDTEEVTGSIPVSRTNRPLRAWLWSVFRPLCGCSAVGSA